MNQNEGITRNVSAPDEPEQMKESLLRNQNELNNSSL